MMESEIGKALDEILRRLTALEVRVGLRPDPAIEAARAAAERPKRSFEDMVMERTLRDHPTTRQMTEAAARAVPDGVVAQVMADRPGRF